MDDFAKDAARSTEAEWVFPILRAACVWVPLDLQGLSSLTYLVWPRCWDVFAVGGIHFYCSFYGSTCQHAFLSFSFAMKLSSSQSHKSFCETLFSSGAEYDSGPKVHSSVYSASQVESKTKRTKHGRNNKQIDYADKIHREITISQI